MTKPTSLSLSLVASLAFTGCALFSSESKRGYEVYRYPDSYLAAEVVKGKVPIKFQWKSRWFGSLYLEETPQSDPKNERSSFGKDSPSESTRQDKNQGASSPLDQYLALLQSLAQRLQSKPNNADDDPRLRLIETLDELLETEQVRQSLSAKADHSALPIKRDISLKCVLPPQQDVKQVSASFVSTLEGLPQAKIANLKVDARYADKVVKLFEQTERTIFLQYALFRMCEMTINSPIEFRNVFPILFHRLVRQAALLSQKAAVKSVESSIEAEKSIQEEEKTKQQEEKTKQARELTVQSRLDCISDQSKRTPAITTDDLIHLCGKAE